MRHNLSENLLAKIIAFGCGFTTIFVISSSVTDPVNLTKFVSLGVTATAAFGVLVTLGLNKVVKTAPLLWILGTLFLLFALLSVFGSASPFSQGIYGSYGRNNGLLTYIFLVILLFSMSTISFKPGISLLLKSLYFAGFINVAYCLWVIVFGDFIGWSNPYGNILGTFGNPNFIGAFLGIFFSSYLAYALGKETPKPFKYSLLLVLPITAFEIYDSSAIQGRIVALTGIAVTLFFYIRSKCSAIVTAIYSLGVTIMGIVAILGALQIGPLASIIYKTSVSLRGQYWLAGWNTGSANPFTGVGMDAFGDWYRRSRDIHALELPGVNVVVNASHNVPLDMFAFGGWPLFILYCSIMGAGAIASLKVIVRQKEYDPIFVAIFTAWLGYQIQSIVSINQIGLAIWGWVLTGAILAYERITQPIDRTEPAKNVKEKNAKSQQALVLKSTVLATIFAIFGLVISLPPLISDTKLRNAQIVRTVDALEDTMRAAYFNPLNTNKFLINIQNLEQSNLPELAHKYALQAVAWNPDAYDLWRILYFIQKSTPEEKSLAVENMRRLDPNNPDVTSIK